MTPALNIGTDCVCAEMITIMKAGSPTSAPALAMRKGSAPLLSTFDAKAKPMRLPPANVAVSVVVAPTPSPNTCPP